jgi:drug/metabolite transporter (DMT)-like permease
VATADIFRLICLGAIWGSSFIFMRVVSPVLGPIVTADSRLFVSGLLLLAYFKIIGFDIEWKKFWKKYVIIGLFSAGLPFFFFAFAARYIPAGYSAILNSTTPMFGAILSTAFLGEKLSLKKLVGLVIGSVGVCCVVQLGTVHHEPIFYLSMLACLAASCSYAIGAVYIKRFAFDAKPKAIAAASQFMASLVLMPAIPLAPVTGQITHEIVICMTVLSLLCSAVAFLLYFQLIANTGPTKALTVTFLIPIFAMIWGVLFLHEKITASMVGGCILILLGISLVLNLLKFPAKTQPRSSPGISP